MLKFGVPEAKGADRLVCSDEDQVGKAKGVRQVKISCTEGRRGQRPPGSLWATLGEGRWPARQRRRLALSRAGASDRDRLGLLPTPAKCTLVRSA
jgi:hypothetical protein